MATHAERARDALLLQPRTSRYLSEKIGVSQPTVSRAMASLGKEVIRIGAGRSIQYAARDRFRGIEDIPVYRVSAEGEIRLLGYLIPVHPSPDALVFAQCDGVTEYFEGLPWWLDDMRPQGFLGRAYAARHGRAFGFPEDCRHWSGTQVLRSLLAHGHDGIGNLLLGDHARRLFLTMSQPELVHHRDFPQLAREASDGETPGSSAGGEQPKFTAYTQTIDGPGHAIVKFAGSGNEIAQRWRDLLLAEHLALETLLAYGCPAARTCLVDEGDQRFLVAERFDRVGERGRIAMISLEVMYAQFVGQGRSLWPEIARLLYEDRRITKDSVAQVQTLWAFGSLIGNSDMHLGNLAFLSEHGQPYQVAPAYDMTPMALAPTRSGSVPTKIPRADLTPSVPATVWRHARQMALCFMGRLRTDERFSSGFSDCIEAIQDHIDDAGGMIDRQE